MDQNYQSNANNGPVAGGPGSYQQPAQPHPVVINQLENKKDGLAVCSLVVGIFSVIFCWGLVIPLILSLIGLITGIVSLVRTNQHTGLALAGVILSAIGLVLCVAIVLLLFMAV
ncbi:MAG TPA: DUF4190 domain-containing protein [Candidatus Eisenbergiella merdipullorum]|uniref:DUF4190 domain-containing protein n=1 Tax=Candidatus Eisenbergiella merdipullorum TaxID=2838553 RepID=A0A9D2I871_9FIRM|nr:DUF4190 domain-containing protein [Candidatus Eisenbergiella merdipullorum]